MMVVSGPVSRRLWKEKRSRRAGRARRQQATMGRPIGQNPLRKDGEPIFTVFVIAIDILPPIPAGSYVIRASCQIDS